MNQPYVIVKADDQYRYLASGYAIGGNRVKWVPVGARRREVFSLGTLREAEAFCETFTKLEGIQVCEVTKWVESAEEVFEILGVHDHSPKYRALDAITVLWDALPEYPPKPILKERL